MVGKSQWKIWSLLSMSAIGIILGIWLSWAGFNILGYIFIGLFLWSAQQFALMLIVPGTEPPDLTPPMSSWWQRLLIFIVCLLGAAVCGLGVYLWRLWPEEWQAGLVFVLFGVLVLAPVTIWQVQLRSQRQRVPGRR